MFWISFWKFRSNCDPFFSSQQKRNGTADSGRGNGLGDNTFYSNIDSMPDIRPRRKSIPLVSELVSVRPRSDVDVSSICVNLDLTKISELVVVASINARALPLSLMLSCL